VHVVETEPGSAQNDPTGAGCLFVPFAAAAGAVGVVLADLVRPTDTRSAFRRVAAYSNSASDNSRYGLPVIRDSHAAYWPGIVPCDV
jgi:hypothetical protein